MAELMRTYDGMGLYAARTDCDKNGAKLTLGIEGTLDFVLDENDDPVLDETRSTRLKAPSHPL